MGIFGVQYGVYTDDLSGNSANWQLIETDGGFYIKNLETQKYLSGTADGFVLKDEAELDDACVVQIFVFSV